MGGVINVLAKFTGDTEHKAFMSEMGVPALKLIGMYIGQV